MLKAMQLTSDGHELELNWSSDLENRSDREAEGRRWHPLFKLLLLAASFRVRELALHKD